MASAVLVGVAGAVYGYYVSFLDLSAMFDIVAEHAGRAGRAARRARHRVGAGARRVHRGAARPRSTNTTLGGEDAGAIRLMMFGGLLLAVALLMPRGILPAVERPLGADGAGERSSPTGSAPGGRRAVPARRRALGGSPRADGDGRRCCASHGVTMRFGGVTALDGATVRRSRQAPSPR